MTNKIIDDLRNNLNDINYLPYKKRFIDTSYKSSKSNSIVKRIKKGSLTNWKIVEFNADSLVRKGFTTYELNKIPKRKT